MCSEPANFETPFETAGSFGCQIAPLSEDIWSRLPRDFANGILGAAAVHMASRQPGNRAVEKTALEIKAAVFKGFNQILQNPQHQRPDIFICVSLMVFAIDVSYCQLFDPSHYLLTTKFSYLSMAWIGGWFTMTEI